jgi:hypothetical protein
MLPEETAQPITTQLIKTFHPQESGALDRREILVLSFNPHLSRYCNPTLLVSSAICGDRPFLMYFRVCLYDYRNLKSYSLCHYHCVDAG